MNQRNNHTNWLKSALFALLALVPAGAVFAQPDPATSDLVDQSQLQTMGIDNATLMTIVNYAYLVAAVMFIFGLKMLTKVKTARRGNLVSSLGMLLACVVTLFLVNYKANPDQSFVISFAWIAGALVIGGGIGLYIAKTVPMTGMPQTVALFNGFGGAASLLVAAGDYFNASERVIGGLPGNKVYELSTYANSYIPLTIGLALLIGGVTFTGSLVAFAKLQGGFFNKFVPDQPVQFPGQKLIIALLLLAGLALSIYLIIDPAHPSAVWLITAFALALGILLVIGIGGADMPVVISLLNSYSGIAAAFAGFVLGNIALIITGALVGASGLILTQIMCKAMNRSLVNVLFGGVGGKKSSSAAGSGDEIQGEARSLTAEDVAIQLDAASQVMIVPGYGMAVAQAQHPVKELADLLESRGVTVKYAIHPVAGRMPGHMNVLLAEAQVPYENLLDLEASNPEFEQTDVALVIGANDVTNPAARHAENSPIYGMPILDVDKARSVVVIKRSLSPGFAGIQNELYFKDNCGMLFGDGKAMVNELVNELKEV